MDCGRDCEEVDRPTGEAERKVSTCFESSSRGIPPLSVGYEPRQIWSETLERAEWRDSDIGESCSDHDYPTVEVEECSADTEESDSEGSGAEDDFGVVFACDSDCHLTPVEVHDSFLCETLEWSDDSESASDSGTVHDDEDLLEEFQPRLLPFCASAASCSLARAGSSHSSCSSAQASNSSRTSCSPAEMEVVKRLKPWSWRNTVGAQRCHNTSAYHRNCISPAEDERSNSSNPGKCVRFRSGPDLVSVHWMFTWNFASRAARRGPWEEMARDRERFTERIGKSEDFFRTVFTEEHRQVWQRKYILCREVNN